METKKYKLAIVGSRNPGISYEEWEILLSSIVSIDEISEIISGGGNKFKGMSKEKKIRVGM